MSDVTAGDLQANVADAHTLLSRMLDEENLMIV